MEYDLFFISNVFSICQKINCCLLMAKLRTNLQQFILTKRFTWKMLEDRRKQGAVYVEQKFVKLKLWKNFNHLNAFFKSKFHRENRNKFWESSKENMSRNQNGIPLIIYPRIPTTEPVARTCPHCLQEIITNPRKKTGRYQQCLSFILCCLILPFCCFWIPLTKDEMNDTIHYCPSCQMVVGIYRYDENNATCMGPMNRYDYFEWNFQCLLLFLICTRIQMPT